MATYHARTIRNRRINLRATNRQEKLIRTGAETSGVSVTDFILESACLQAEHILADKREFATSPKHMDGVRRSSRPARSRETEAGAPLFRAARKRL